MAWHLLFGGTMRYSRLLSTAVACVALSACGGNNETVRSPEGEHSAEHANDAAERAEDKADRAADKAEDAAKDADKAEKETETK